MLITYGEHTLTAGMNDTPTSMAIKERLPMTLSMNDLYSREMCYRFPEALPDDGAEVSSYDVGDIVYYPPMHSFVIMYEQNGEEFLMVKIGHIDDGVEVFDGVGTVDVSFSLIQ